MRHLPAICIIVILAITPSCKSIREKGLFGGKRDTLVAWQVRQDSIRFADSINNAEEGRKAAELAIADSLNRIESERLVWESPFRYNIIVGSFYTPDYAQSHAETYKGMGYDPKIIQLPGSKFELVSAEGYDDFTKAVERLAQFQDTIEINAWLYEKN